VSKKEEEAFLLKPSDRVCTPPPDPSTASSPFGCYRFFSVPLFLFTIILSRAFILEKGKKIFYFY
jgi:hypothetical protein